MVATLLPRLVLGEQSYVTIHDNLDFELIVRTLVARQGAIFTPEAMIEPMMGGLPRSTFPTGLNLATFLFSLLPPFWCYVLIDVFNRGVAFAGMYLLGRDHLWTIGTSNRHNDVESQHGVDANRLIVGVAACFALLPFYPLYGLTIAGQPLLAWALWQLWKRQQSPTVWAILILFPFTSVLATGGIFLVASAIIAGACGFAFDRDVRLPYLGGVAVLIGGYLVSDWSLLSDVLVGSGYISHRANWRLPGSPMLHGFGAALQKTWRCWVFGQYHAASLHTPIIGVAAIAAIGDLFGKSKDVRSHRTAVIALLGCTGLAASSFGFNSWTGLDPVRALIPMLRTLNIRFYWLLPLLWFSTLVLSLTIVSQWRNGRLVAGGVILLQVFWCLGQPTAREPELRVNVQMLANKFRNNTPSQAPLTYAEFFSTNLFQKIGNEIGTPGPTNRVISVGLHPSIALYNGLWTVDGYHNNYPRAYHQAFIGMVGDELAKDRHLRRRLEDWGSRLYLLPAQTYRDNINRRPAVPLDPISDLDIDLQALHALGGTHILSTREIMDPDLLVCLEYLGNFSEASSPWSIHLYRNPPGCGARQPPSATTGPASASELD